MVLWPSRENGVTVHGSLVRIGNEGILLRGEAGVGKSTAALEYLAAGGQLVADDIVSIQRVGEELYGSSPTLLAGLLSVPELGIFDVREVLGPQYFVATSVITRCVDLCSVDETNSIWFEPGFHGVKLPQTYQRVIRSRKRAAVPLAIDPELVRQSESKFLASHSKILAGVSLS